MESTEGAIYDKENVHSFGNFYPLYGEQAQYVHLGQSFFTHDNFLFTILKDDGHQIAIGQESDYNSECDQEDHLSDDVLPLANTLQPSRRANRRGSRGMKKQKKR